MTTQLTEDTFNSLKYFLKGNMAAVQFALDLIYLSHIIDDLVDRDVERDNEDIKKAFRILIVDQQHNPFYMSFRGVLDPLMASAFMLWLDSTYLETGSDTDRFTAFMIRNDTLKVIQHCLLLVGGPEWQHEQGPDFWRVFGIKETKLDEFKHEGINEFLSELPGRAGASA
jgi:hypothetical protein